MTAGLRSSWFGVTVLFAVAACQGNQRTELVVEVDSNLAVPSQMDNVQVAVTAKGKTQYLPCSLQGGCKLPWDVGIVEATAGAGILEIVATGYSGTTLLSTRPPTSASLRASRCCSSCFWRGSASAIHVT